MTERPDTSMPDMSRPDEGLDPANQSLADALRVSFWILKTVMILLVIAFLGWSRHSGFFTVPPQQQALVLRFGAIEGPGAPKLPGNHWSWPYPIESRVMVDVRVKSFEVETFFFARDARMRTQPLEKLVLGGGTLTPGQDGCLITGDHNILHAIWAVEYQVTDIRDYLQNVSDEKALVSAALNNAVLRTVAHYKADDLLSDRIAEIQAEARKQTDEHLAKLNAGISVRSVSVKMPTPPLQVLSAFLAVNESVSEADRLRTEAQREADDILNAVAGPAHEKLADAISRYELARGKKDDAAAGRIQEEIDALLLSDETKGQAGEMLDAARSYKTDWIQAIRAEADYFLQLKAKYDANPEIVLRRLWLDTRQDILENAVYKVFLAKGEPLIIDINKPPRWDKAEKKAQLEAVGKQRP